MFRKIMNSRKGAAAIEYALLISLIAIASMGSVDGVGSSLRATFGTVAMYLGVGMS